MVKIIETGHVKYNANAGRPPANDNVRVDVLLSVADNPHGISKQIADDRYISKWSVFQYHL